MSLYPFDPVGNLQANRILNEIHTVSAINGVNHNYLVPDAAPFYAESMVVISVTTGEALRENVHYYFAYSFQDATDKVGKPIYGAVVFIDPQQTGSFRLNYQTLGGEYVNEETRAIEDGLETLDALIHRDWSEIVNLPSVFPPTPHMTRLNEVTGVAALIAKLEEITLALYDRPRQITLTDIADLEQEYTQPLLDSISTISAAIDNLNERSTHYYVDGNTTNDTTVIFNALEGMWYNIGLALTVGYSGAFMVALNGTPFAQTDNGVSQVAMRFLIDGIAVSQSNLPNAVVGLTQGQVVSVQVAVLGGDASEIRVSGPEHGCGLTLLRVSQ